MDVLKWGKDNPALVALILSGLVMPGLGQWTQKRRVWSVGFMAAVLSLLVAVFVRGWIDMYRSMSVSTDLDSIFPTVGEVLDLFVSMAASNWHLLLVIAVIWIWSAVDAYVAGRRMVKE